MIFPVSQMMHLRKSYVFCVFLWLWGHAYSGFLGCRVVGMLKFYEPSEIGVITSFQAAVVCDHQALFKNEAITIIHFRLHLRYDVEPTTKGIKRKNKDYKPLTKYTFLSPKWPPIRLMHNRVSTYFIIFINNMPKIYSYLYILHIRLVRTT